MKKKHDWSGTSAAIVGFMFFSSMATANSGAYYRPAISEEHNSNLKSKYPRVVIFGDSQLDTNNVSKAISLKFAGIGFEHSLSLGTPFTAGKGNAAQQLFGKEFLAGNPMYYKTTFSPPMIPSFDVELSSKNYSGEISIDNAKNVNMAQGGSRVLATFPGDGRQVLGDIIVNAIRSSNLSASVKSSLYGAIWAIGSQVKNTNIDLLRPIADQPKIFAAHGGRFNHTDLAMVLAGGNDVIAQGYSGAENLETQKKEIGKGREKLIDDIAKLGAKNIFLGNIPDIRLVPTSINWESGSTNTLHRGVAKEATDARRSMTELMLSLNEQTTSSALVVARNNPGVTITIFDIFKFFQHANDERERYGIVNDMSVSCESVPACNKDRSAEGGKYLTEDGLHPSDKVSEVIANAYKHYLHDTRRPLGNRMRSENNYDAYFDAFSDVVVTREGSESTHNIVGGVLDLSLRSQVDSLTPKVVLNGALLRFDDSTEKSQNSQYAHQMNVDLLVKERHAGIEVANAGSEFLYSGNASGFGFLKTGLGTLVLTGNNDFVRGDRGAIGIVAGSLQVGNGGDIGSLGSETVHTLEKSSLAFNHSVDHSFSGRVLGSGALLKKGHGVLTLTGDNEHSGGTVISAGTLKIGDGGDQGWLQGNVLNNAVMMFNRSDDKQFDGQINGSGSIVKIGTGSLNLTGSGRISGRTEVISGKLGFNGGFDATDVRVGNGALVYGDGTVRSLRLDAGGAIAPGNSIGVFNVVNDIVFNKGSVYAVDANATGLSDRINVGGVAYVNGGDVLVDAEYGSYSPGNTYTVLSARHGVNGRFDSVSANFAFLDPVLSYTNSDVSLLLARNQVKPVDLCQSKNQKAICAQMLSLLPQPEVEVMSTAPIVESRVALTPQSSVIEGLVAPGSVAPPTLTTEAEILVDERSSLLKKETDVVISMSKPEFIQFAELLPGEIHPAVKATLAQDSSHIRESVSKRMYETERGISGSGAWGHVFGSEGRQDGSKHISGLSRKNQGFILGRDVLVEDSDVNFGVFGGYRKTSMSQGASSADVGTYNLGIYGSKRYDALSLRLGASFSWHDIETKRKIFYKDKASTPDANYRGDTAQLFSEVAYDVKFGGFSVEPFAGLSYTRLAISGFSEEKDLFSVSGKRDVKDIYAGTLGSRINFSTQYSNDVKVNFQAGAGLKHTFSDVSSSTSMALQSHGNSYRVNGLPLKKNIAQLSVKVAVQTKDGFSIGLDYMAEKAGGMQDQSVSAFASWEF